MQRYEKPDWQKEIAGERIDILFEQALAQVKANRFDLSNRYVFLARKLAMKYKVQIPRELRRLFCHKCYHYLTHGKNVEVRTNSKTQAVEYKCKDCGRVNRYPYIKEKIKRRILK